MKTLYINRHAKSSHGQEAVNDFDRVLSERGIEDASEMGHRLKMRGEKFDSFVSSPAVRAISTARRIARETHYPPDEIVEKSELYNAGITDIFAVITGLDDRDDSVILFGHNPGFSEIITYLTGQSMGSLPTCGIAKIVFKEADTWKEISRGIGELEYVDHPGDEF